MLINCAAYREGRKLADIIPGDIPLHLADPGTFVWVALHDASDEELATLQRAFDLHPLAVEDVQRGQQRPKVEEYGESLFVVMHLLVERPVRERANEAAATVERRDRDGDRVLEDGLGSDLWLRADRGGDDGGKGDAHGTGPIA